MLALVGIGYVAQHPLSSLRSSADFALVTPLYARRPSPWQNRQQPKIRRHTEPDSIRPNDIIPSRIRTTPGSRTRHCPLEEAIARS